jgi:sulfatase modifying factor 1
VQARTRFKLLSLGTSRLLLVGALALGCGQILDISEPTPRPTSTSGGQGGQVGQPSEGGSANMPAAGGALAGAGMSDAAGEGGALGGSAGESGAAGSEPLAGAGDTNGQAGMATGGNAGGGGMAGGGGGAGAAPKVCGLAQQRCDPDSSKTPQVCNAFGEWLRNPAEGSGLDCPIACDPSSGKCVECQGSETTCNGNYVKTCADGAWTQAPLPCAEFCKQGACVNVSSCASPNLVCGADSCCLSLEVEGGMFARDDDATYMATITSFTMDKYEVTVGRLVAFYNWLYSSQGAAPAVGAGKSPHIAEDTGWSSSYPLPATSQDMQAMLSCANVDPSADPTPTFLNADQALPANCVDFYVAYALCIWDGGRLPTEAEWNYAASGGSDQRYYPWSDPPSSTSLDATRAVYGGSEIAEVGSVPAGNGRFGQADLEGNVSEWTLDYAGPYPTSCVDCLQTTISTNRATRGGAYSTQNARGLKVALRGDADPGSPTSIRGFRCVHDL